MDFAAFVEVVNAIIMRLFADAEARIELASAVWSRIDGYYTATLRDLGNGSIEVAFTIGDGGDDFGLVPLAADSVDDAAELVEMALRAADTHYFTGRYAPDPGIRDMGDAWSYTDADGRHVHGTRHNAASLHHLDGAIVSDPALGGQLPFYSYIDDDRATQKHRTEISDVGRLLATTGEWLTSMVVADKPDVHITRHADPNSWAYVEHARVVVQRSAELDAVLDSLNQRLRELAQEPALAARLADTDLQVGIRYDVALGQFPKPNAVIQELRQLIESADFDSLARDERMPFPATYPQFHRFHLAFIRRASPGARAITLRRIDTYNDARILAELVKTRLETKLVLSKGYALRPLWLALYVNDSAGHTDFTLNALDHKTFNFAPFDLLVIGDEHGLINFEV
jgi:hypothetical protein